MFLLFRRALYNVADVNVYVKKDLLLLDTQSVSGRTAAPPITGHTASVL